MVVKLLNLGANDYIQKPFRREILHSRLKAQISAHQNARWRTKVEKLQELGQLVSGIGHQGKNRIGRVGSNYKGLIKAGMEAVAKLEAVDQAFAEQSKRKIQVMGDLVDKGYKQTLDLFNAIDRYASGSTKKTKIFIEEVFYDTLTLLEDRCIQGNVQIKQDIPAELCFEGHNEFREAILNIVSNAIDALEGTENPCIEIQAREKDDKIIIEIKDNGPGIEKENLHRVFEAFYTNKEVGKGTGLGLYLARDAVELKNHGQLRVRSEGLGKGAQFQIVVPKNVESHSQEQPKMHNVRV
ncbi:MAG: HAMP domain-containing sensor histidine kinase [Bdellovibrionota bacterium]